MKKLHFLVLGAVIILSACSKTDYLAKEKELLLNEINNVIVSKVHVTNLEEILVSNCNNPYDALGEITGDVSIKILNKGLENKTDVDSLKAEFLYLIAESLPASTQKIDTSDISEIENVITAHLLNIYTNEGFDVFVIKSKEIEDLICKTGFFNEHQKARLLTFSSIMRHNTYTIRSWFQDNESKRESEWEDCFIEKLRELQDCGNCWLEKITCALSWPTCLGVKALDCAIDAIIN